MITAQEINKLRQQTGAGMMDCKKALTEAQGDFQEAVAILRKKGQKISAARADRATTEGAMFAATNDDASYGVLIALSCETDFVAKNDVFQDLGTTILKIALSDRPETKEALLATQIEGTALQEKITDLMGKIGEKITLSTYEILEGETIVPYIHAGSKLGVLVALAGSKGEQVVVAGKDVAMQIAAMNPQTLDESGMDPDFVARELEIGREQAKNEGKPAELIERIAQGRLAQVYKECTLLNQIFVKDKSLTVKKYLTQVASGLTVTAFKRCTVDAN